MSRVDDHPIFEEARLSAVDFAPRAIRPRSRHEPLLAGAWAVGLAALIGVGVLARGPASEPRVARDDTGEAPGTTETSAAMSGPHRPPAGSAAIVTDVVDLESPAPARVEVTTRAVVVEGSMLVHAARVEIFLEAHRNRLLDHVSVDVSDPNGGVRPERAPTFSASFDLPFPRPNGTMWVVVIAYDEHGLPLGGTRRPFAVGPLLDEGADSRSENPPP